MDTKTFFMRVDNLMDKLDNLSNKLSAPDKRREKPRWCFSCGFAYPKFTIASVGNHKFVKTNCEVKIRGTCMRSGEVSYKCVIKKLFDCDGEMAENEIGFRYRIIDSFDQEVLEGVWTKAHMRVGESIEEWITVKLPFTLLDERAYLFEIFDNIVSDGTDFTSNDILYIYKGNIVCHKNKHSVIQATAILHNQTDNEIELNVEFCTECKKYLLEYSLFEQYRKRYGVLIGNLRIVTNGSFDGEYDLALESPLRLSGYNVSQKDGFSARERQYILARIIHDEIMSKGEVIRYLTYFISRNGAKYGNELAVEKWEEDLAFVQEYDMDTQPRAIISQIKKY